MSQGSFDFQQIVVLPGTFHMEPENGGGWKMIFLFRWVLCWFQPLNFKGVSLMLKTQDHQILHEFFASKVPCEFCHVNLRVPPPLPTRPKV